jgi:hypothetical protein
VRLATDGSVTTTNVYGTESFAANSVLANGVITQWFTGPDTNGQIVNRIVLANGAAYEYDPAAAAWVQTDSQNTRHFYAGVDAEGRPATVRLATDGSVTTTNVYGTESFAANSVLANGVITQWFTGTDSTGQTVNQVVLAGGSVYEYDPALSNWQQIGTLSAEATTGGLVGIGTPHQFTLEALDAWGNVATGYTGTLHFTSSDPKAVLPADYTFTAKSDQGQHVFSITLGDNTNLVQSSATVTAVDSANNISQKVTVTIVPPGAPDQLSDPEVPTATAGIVHHFNFTALDQNGNIVWGYTGTLHFTSSDPDAVLPADYTFNGKEGTHAFDVTFHTAGTQTITAIDTVTGISTTETVTVAPGRASQLVAYETPVANPVVAGTSQTLYVQARDAWGNIVTGYTGTIHFASSDPNASLPAGYTFNGSEGTHGFEATFLTAGSQTVTLSDTANGIGGSLKVTVQPGPVAGFLTLATSPAGIGREQIFELEPLDAWGNEVTSYKGTVHFTSSDPKALLPANYTYDGSEGDHSFVLTFNDAGNQTVTARDMANGLSATAAVHVVIVAAPLVTVSDPGGDHNGSPFRASGSIKGEAGANLGTPAFTYYAGISATGTPLAGAPVDAGTYTVVASFAGNSLYPANQAETTFTIDQATPSVTVNDRGGVYDGSPFQASGSATGVGGVNLGTPTFTYYAGSTATGTPLAGAPADAGTYTVVASYQSRDYALARAQTTFTIARATLTSSVVVANKVYDGSTAATIAARELSGVVPGDDVALVGGTATFDRADAGVGKVVTVTGLTLSGTKASDYLVAGDATTTANVAPALLNILPTSGQYKKYGALVPSLTYVNSGLPSNLTGTLGTVASQSSPVGDYAFTLGTLNAGADYTLQLSPSSPTFSVVPAALTVTVNDQMMAYGATLPALTLTYGGFVNGDTAASLTTGPTVTTTATDASGAGPYPITASGAVDPNYTITYAPGTLTVTPARLTITADDQTKAYGAALPTLTFHSMGFVNGDTASSLTTAPTVTTVPATSGVGMYPITASGAVDPNYTITYVPGKLTITAVPLTITADNQSKVYGAGLPALTVHYSGFVNGDTASSLTTAPTVSTVPATSGVGMYPITASGAVDANYTITYAPGTLTITAAPLTITADDKSKVYGAALPTLTFHGTGFVNGDTAASLTTAPTLTTTATAASAVSTFPITASGAVDANYTITYAPGTLTVTLAPLTITADNQTKAYGAALPTLTFHSTGFVNGDTASSLTTAPTVTTTATTSSNAGTYSITAKGAVDPNYTITFVAGSLTITPVALTITADNQTMVAGTALPALTVHYAGFVNGDTAASLVTQPVVSTTGTSASPAGSYAITVSGATDPNYTISFVPGTLTITPVVVTAQLITKKVGKKKQLVIEVFENGTQKSAITSPFQKPAFKNIQVSVQGNQVVLTAKKGKKTMTRIFAG